MSEALEHEIRTLRAHFWSDRDPDGRAFAPLAEAYLAKGDVEEALALVEDGLGRLPDYATGHLVAARVHRARGDRAAARSAVEALLGLDRGNAPGLRLLGELAEEAGESGEAVTAFQEALQRDPGYADLEGRIARLTDPGVGEVAPPPPNASLPEVEAGGFEVTHEPGPTDARENPETPEPTDAHGPRIPPDAHPDAHDAPDAPVSLEDDLAFRSFDDEGPQETDPGDQEEWPAATEPGGGVGDPEGDRSPPLVTRTMAELYVRQGFLERGVEVYRQLAEQDPENRDLAERLEELEETLSIQSAEGDAPADQGTRMAGRAHEGEAGFPSRGQAEDDDPAGVAPQWAGGDPAGSSLSRGTPFAWAPEDSEGGEEAGEGEAHDGPTAARYFEDLLAWEPGAVPIASLGPEGGMEPSVREGADEGGGDDGPPTPGEEEGRPDPGGWGT